MDIKLEDHHKKNLMEFLNRVELKGFQECFAMNEIYVLLNPQIQQNIAQPKE